MFLHWISFFQMIWSFVEWCQGLFEVFDLNFLWGWFSLSRVLLDKDYKTKSNFSILVMGWIKVWETNNYTGLVSHRFSFVIVPLC